MEKDFAHHITPYPPGFENLTTSLIGDPECHTLLVR